MRTRNRTQNGANSLDGGCAPPTGAPGAGTSGGALPANGVRLPSPAPPAVAAAAEAALLDEDVIDLRQYIAVLKKWRGVIAMITLCAVVTAAILSYFVLPPVYETKTLVMVAQPVSSPDKISTAKEDGSLESVINRLASIPLMTMNTYVAQVKDYNLMQRTIQALGEQGEGLTPKGLLGAVEAKALKDTNLIEITVRHTDPVLAAAIANTLRQEFLAYVSENNQQKMKSSLEFLENQIAQEQKKIDDLSSQLRSLEAEPRNQAFLLKELDARYADLTKYQSLANQARFEYQQALAGRDRLQEQLSGVPQVIAAASGSGSAPAVNPAYTALSEALVKKETELAEKGAQLSAAYEIIASIEADIRALHQEASAKKQVMDRINADLEQAKKTYNLLNEKRTQTQIVQAVNLGETYILPVSSAPVPSSPVKPKKALNMAVAAVLGLMFSVLLAFLLEFLDNTVKDAGDAEALFGLPVLASIPLMGERPRRRRRPPLKKEEQFA